jgi:hypothetical protein
MSSRSQLRTRCAARFGDSAGSIISPAAWNDYIADAERDVYAASPWWPWNEALTTTLTASTTGLVSLPVDTWRVNSVYDVTDDYPLVPLEGRADYLNYFSQAAGAQSQPTNYRLRGSTLEVLPHPQVTTSLAIEYMAPPSLMTADDDTPEFPPAWHQMLVSGALARAYEDDGNTGQAQLHWAKFTALLEQLKDAMLQTRAESYHGIQDIW